MIKGNPVKELLATATQLRQAGHPLDASAMEHHARAVLECRTNAATCAAGRDKGQAREWERRAAREIEQATRHLEMMRAWQ